MPKIDPIVAKAAGLQNQGVKGEVVFGCHPLSVEQHGI
jgi:hypothetical protein